MNRRELLTDSFQVDQAELNPPIKQLGSGEFGTVYLHRVTGELKRRLQEKKLCNESGLVAVKMPKGNVTEKVREDYIKEGLIATHLYNQCSTKNRLESANYNLSIGATINNEPAIITKFEGRDYIAGDVKNFLASLIRLAPQDPGLKEDLDIIAMQIMSSQYNAIEEMHDDGVLHLDVANRNFLMRAPRPDELTETGEVLNFAAVASDYGMSEIPKNQSLSMTLNRTTAPIKWMDKEMLTTARVSPKTNLYSLRACLIETFAALDGMSSDIPLGTMDENVQWVHTKTDSERLTHQYTTLARNLFNVNPLLDCYQLYMRVVPGALNLSLEEYKKLDKSFFLESNLYAIQQMLINRINKNFNNPSELASFVTSVKRLMYIAVSDGFKHSEIHQLCIDLINETDATKRIVAAEKIRSHVQANKENWKRNQIDKTRAWLGWQQEHLTQQAMQSYTQYEAHRPSGAEIPNSHESSLHDSDQTQPDITEASSHQSDAISANYANTRRQHDSGNLESREDPYAGIPTAPPGFDISKQANANLETREDPYAGIPTAPPGFDSNKQANANLESREDPYAGIPTAPPGFDSNKQANDPNFIPKKPAGNSPQNLNRPVFGSHRLNKELAEKDRSAPTLTNQKDIYQESQTHKSKKATLLHDIKSEIKNNAKSFKRQFSGKDISHKTSQSAGEPLPNATRQKKSNLFQFFQSPFSSSRTASIDYDALNELIDKIIRSIEYLDADSPMNAYKKISQDLTRLMKLGVFKADKHQECGTFAVNLNKTSTNKHELLNDILLFLKNENSYTLSLSRQKYNQP